MAGVFRDAGLRHVTEVEVSTPCTFADAEQYFAFMTEVAAPVVAGMAKADAAARVAIKDEVLRLASAHVQVKDGGAVRLDATAIVVTGERA